MPHVKTQTVYYFEELSDRAKEKARDWYREGDRGNDFADPVLEDAVRMAALLGLSLTPDMIFWSGFSSQGDGASFAGTYSYVLNCVDAVASEAPTTPDQPGNTELNRIVQELAWLQAAHGNALTAAIERSTSRYAHALTMQITVNAGDEAADATTTDGVTELLRDFARWIYRQLEAEYDYQQSDACIDELITINEYEFTEDGRRAC